MSYTWYNSDRFGLKDRKKHYVRCTYSDHFVLKDRKKHYIRGTYSDHFGLKDRKKHYIRGTYSNHFILKDRKKPTHHDGAEGVNKNGPTTLCGSRHHGVLHAQFT